MNRLEQQVQTMVNLISSMNLIQVPKDSPDMRDTEKRVKEEYPEVEWPEPTPTTSKDFEVF